MIALSYDRIVRTIIIISDLLDLQELLSIAEMRRDVVAESELLLVIEDLVVENTNLAGWF